MKSIILAIVIACAFAINLRSNEFAEYKVAYGKVYSNNVEARYRQQVFEDNLRIIEEHNAKKLSWELGVNHFADMTQEEFQTKFCGCAKDPMGGVGRVQPIYGDAPERVDWREKGAITPVKNQGSCGSCWAFSVVATTESTYFIKKGKLIDLSEQQLVDCAKRPKYDAIGCSGGWPHSVADYVKDVGLCTQEEYPYHAKDEECKDDQCTIVVKSTGKVVLPQGDEDSLTNAVAEQPVSIVLDASTFSLYKGGIITKCGESINHAVLAAGYGYDDELQLKYYLIKNSWGKGWGEEGYCRIEKDVGGMGRCGLTYSSVYPTF